MQQKIAILSEKLCNQIAAGEVVERPSSVVKELVENALDAGAKQITVEVERGGKKLIRVSDDGCGMGSDDIFLCFERHATSKIRSENDLFHLQFLGFRGEALPSISAVSRLTVSSRQTEDSIGNRLQLVGGVVRHHEQLAIAGGTCFEVKDLFFNLPARRKFLRRDETEFGHIAEIVTRLSLPHYYVQFKLIHNGRVILDLYRQKNQRDRIADLLGRPVVQQLIEVDGGEKSLKLTGYVAHPSLNRSTTQAIYSFINGRFVKDRVLQHAILDGYRQLLMKGRYPVCVLFLTLDSEKVDVNVHPTKHEVRFHDQRMVHDFVSQTIRQTLRCAEPAPVAAEIPSSLALAVPLLKGKTAFAGQSAMERLPADRCSSGFRSALVQESESAYLQHERLLSRLEPDQTPSGEDTPGLPVETRGYFASLTIIGQFHRSYILCEDGEDLVLIDQHAAHERIGFERLKKQYIAGGIERQELLFPEILDLNLREDAELQENLEGLKQLGFDLEPFGGTSWALKAVPAILGEVDVKTMVCDMLSEFASVGVSGLSQLALDHVLIQMACHGMIRANQRLVADEMTALLDQLDNVDFNRHCPHGRPVMQRITLRDLEKMFRRA